MKAYDIHVATDECLGVDHDGQRKALEELGFRDDRLVHQTVLFDKQTARFYQACELIKLHMSRKLEQAELPAVCAALNRVMIRFKAKGYWHSECVELDKERQTPESPVFHEGIPLPFHRLCPCPRRADKEWDLHLCYKSSDLSDKLKDALVERGGFYYLERMKFKNGEDAKHSVFTVQGVHHPLGGVKEGIRFFHELLAWLHRSGGPQFDIKMEVTSQMQLYREPSRVPPTIKRVRWRKG